MFDIPSEYIDITQNTLNGTSSAIPCPYPAPEMYWRNGDSALASIGEIKSALRFGGWGVDRDGLQKIDGLPPQLPADWQLSENLVSKTNGKQYSAYTTRRAFVAPVIRRYRWNTFSNRSEVQYLCYLAEAHYKPWGFVLMSAKSHDSKALDSIFKEFEVKSAEHRANTPINYFYVPVGTFGEIPYLETRIGKGGKSSQVTPPQLGIPKTGLTAESVKQAFVGKEVAADIYLALQNPAVKDWVNDWKKAEKNDAPVVPEPEVPNEDNFPY